jgi:hypothetical protein
MTDAVVHPEGHVDVVWNDGSSSQYPSLAALTAEIQEVDDDSDLTKKLALAWILARSPDLDPITQIQNKNFIFDVSHANPIRVQ